LMAVAMMLLMGIAVIAWGYISSEREAYTNNIAPRHIVSVLDPAKTRVNISQDTAVQIIKEKGFQPKDARIRLMEAKDWGKIYWEIKWYEKNIVSFKIDADNGEIIGMDNFGCYEKDIKNVTANNAVEIALQKLEAFIDIPENLGEASLEIKNITYGKIFSIIWKQEMEGIPVENGFLKVKMDPAGNILSFRKIWHSIDIIIAPTIKKEEAIDISKGISKELPEILQERIEKAKKIDARLVIKRPTNFLNKSKPVYEDYSLLWCVVFSNSEGAVEIQIDAHSGEWVGIDFTK